MHPCGLLWTLALLTNHSDEYYVGLDGIELLDDKGKPIDVLSCANVSSLPQSITDLGLSDPADDRRVTNLFSASQRIFLSPLCRNITDEERKLCAGIVSMHDNDTDRVYTLPKHNVLFIMFDYPTCVSAIRYCLFPIQ